jgi:hypothetical protein
MLDSGYQATARPGSFWTGKVIRCLGIRGATSRREILRNARGGHSRGGWKAQAESIEAAVQVKKPP